MRVLHVDTSRTWRGGQRQLIGLVAEPQRGLEHVVAVRAGSPVASALGELGVSTAAVDGPMALWSLKRTLRPDILHAHDALALRWAALVGGPLVAHRRVDFPPSAWSGWKYRRASRVVAVSEAIRGVLRRAGVAGDVIRLVSDGVAPSTVTRRPEPGLVLSVGALVPHKGHQTLISAWPVVRARCPGARLVIVGEGPLRDRLCRQAFRAGVAQSVDLPGFQDDVAGWLARAELLAHPSIEEGLGSAVLEAFAAGTPVVASQAGGLRELVDETSGWTYPAGDVAGLAERVVEALTAPRVEVEARVSRGAAIAAARSFGVMAARTRDVWDEALDRSAAKERG